MATPGPSRAAARDRVEPCSSGTLALTFDDGPSATQTPRLVGILEQANVPATFFMLGQRVAAAPHVARQVSESGFLVGNHSYAHEDLTTRSADEIRRTLRRTAAALHRAGAWSTDLMRPPYGAVNERVLEAIRDAGLRPVLWDIDPRDWESGSADDIAARVLARLRPHESNVVLLHDGVANSPASVSAVPRIISGARRRGYCFVALDEHGRPGFPTPRATLHVDDVPEGRAAAVTVTIDRPAGRAVSLRVATHAGTARGDIDFRRTGERVVIPAGATTGRVSVPVWRDHQDEPTERFLIVLSRPFGLSLATSEARVRIADRDPEPVVRGRTARVVEPDGGATTVPVRLELDRVSGRQVRLVVRTAPGTAGPEDYVAMERRVTIPAGERFVDVLVTIQPDELTEPSETFTLQVVSATHARVGAAALVAIDP